VVFTGGPSTPLTWSGLTEALGAYTIGSSYVNHPDDQTGAIEEGRLADCCARP
jgi:predicted amidohydrolase YtcJ